MHKTLAIHPAQSSDAPVLSQLACVSKAHWGYDAAFIAACADELTITPNDINRYPTFTLRDERTIVGFYLLVPAHTDAIVLDYLYLAPTHIGYGLGRILFEHVKQTAQALGYHTLHIQADPHAAPFYEHMGASLIGTQPSASIAGRVLPLYHLSLE